MQISGTEAAFVSQGQHKSHETREVRNRLGVSLFIHTHVCMNESPEINKNDCHV